MTDAEFAPVPVTGLDIAFGGDMKKLMPKRSDVEAAKVDQKWTTFFSALFYRGIKVTKLSPKEGIDGPTAFAHIRAIAGSFEPKHDHKEKAIAYLASIWFDDIQYERVKS